MHGVQLPVGFGRSLQRSPDTFPMGVYGATTCGIWQVVAGHDGLLPSESAPCNYLWDLAGRCSEQDNQFARSLPRATTCGIWQVVAESHSNPVDHTFDPVQLPVGFGRSLQITASVCSEGDVLCNYLWDLAGRCSPTTRWILAHRLNVQLPVGFGRSLQRSGGCGRCRSRPRVQLTVGFSRSLQEVISRRVQLPVGFGRSLQWCNHLWELAG